MFSILLISNIYPSEKYPYRGTFVKTFEEQLVNNNFLIFKKCVLRYSKYKLIKTIRYFNFILLTSYHLIKGRFEYDCIYIHYINHSLIPLRLCYKFINKPMILNAHGGDVLLENSLNLVISKFTRMIVKKANMLVVPSSYFKKVVKEKFDIEERRIFISPSGGIDTSFFRPMIRFYKEILSIGYVGRIERNKGWLILLNACNRLKKEYHKKFQLEIIGTGSDLDMLKKKVQILDLEYEVIVHGPASKDDLGKIFPKFDVFVFPTYRDSESLGLVGLEAMACGVPVIGTQIGGLVNYIKHRQNGYFFKDKNESNLLECILNFIKLSEKERTEMSENARLTALKYDSGLIGNELSDKIRAIIEEHI